MKTMVFIYGNFTITLTSGIQKVEIFRSKGVCGHTASSEGRTASKRNAYTDLQTTHLKVCILLTSCAHAHGQFPKWMVCVYMLVSWYYTTCSCTSVFHCESTLTKVGASGSWICYPTTRVWQEQDKKTNRLWTWTWTKLDYGVWGKRHSLLVMWSVLTSLAAIIIGALHNNYCSVTTYVHSEHESWWNEWWPTLLNDYDNVLITLICEVACTAGVWRVPNVDGAYPDWDDRLKLHF